MNAIYRWAALVWVPRGAEGGRRGQRGFALGEAGRRPGLAPREANARARFEHEARQALREWLML